MEITKALKPFIRRGANTFGNIVYMENNAKWRLRVFAHEPVTSLARDKVTAGVNGSQWWAYSEGRTGLFLSGWILYRVMKFGFPVESTTIRRALNNQNASVGTSMVPVKHQRDY